MPTKVTQRQQRQRQQRQKHQSQQRPDLSLLFGESESDSEIEMASYKYDMTNSNLGYSGKVDDDLQSFLSRFEDYATLRDFTGEKKVLALNSCISGHAQGIFRNY